MIVCTYKITARVSSMMRIINSIIARMITPAVVPDAALPAIVNPIEAYTYYVDVIIYQL